MVLVGPSGPSRIVPSAGSSARATLLLLLVPPITIGLTRTLKSMVWCFIFFFFLFFLCVCMCVLFRKLQEVASLT
jgi:hypothetical protein